MSLFNYPKGKHLRQQSPRQFKNYGRYKRFLQHEFARVCVYCRQPDTSAPNLNFGVDHYRPKSLPKFKGLVCDYSNLYYCCGICNSRKNADWPVDESKGPYVVNPCEHDMAQHLRFAASTGTVDSRTAYGQHTADLLQLNAEDRVKYRLNALLTLQLCDGQLTTLDAQLAAIRQSLRTGKMSQEVHDDAVAEIDSEKFQIIQLKQSVNGQVPLAPIRATKLNVSLVK